MCLCAVNQNEALFYVRKIRDSIDIISVDLFLLSVSFDCLFSLIFTFTSHRDYFTFQISRTEWKWWCKYSKRQPSVQKWQEKIRWTESHREITVTLAFAIVVPKKLKRKPIFTKLTPARNCRLMMKNPFPLIEISKLFICDRSSCLAKCNLSLSPAQNVNFSMFLINSVFYILSNRK